jgi:hypothetical protein
MGYEMMRSDINDTEDLMYEAESNSEVNLFINSCTT